MAPLLVLVIALAASGLQNGPPPSADAGVPLPTPDAGTAPRNGGDGGVPRTPAPDGGTPDARPGAPVLVPVQRGDAGVGAAAPPGGSLAVDPGLPPATVIEGQETVVTASREPRRADREGRALNVISEDELARHPPRTTPEALRDEEGVFVQRTNTGGGAPFIRGLYGQHVLILVDGVRLNNATTRSGPNQSLNTVDPFWVEQLEVLRGPGSVLYGSDALGGVVNVLSPRPRFSGDDVSANGQLRLLAGSADRSLQGHLRAGLSLSDVAVLGGVTGRRFGDLTGGARVGVQRYTAYQEYDAGVNLRQRLAPGSQLLLQYQVTRQSDAPRTDRSVPGDFRIFANQERDFAHARGEFAAVGPFRLAADLSLHRQSERAERFRVEQDRIDREEATVWSVGGRVEATATPDLEALGRASVTFGADTMLDRVLSATGRGTITGFGDFSAQPELARHGPAATQLASGLFAFLTADPQPYGLRGGVRVQYNDVRHGEDRRLTTLYGLAPRPADALQTVGFAAELGVSRLFAPGITGLVNVSTGFRSPNVDDLLRLGSEGPGFVIPGGALRPEQSYTAETGVRLQRGIVTVHAYYAFTHVDGLVAAVPVSVAGETLTPDGQRYLQRRNTDAADLHAIDGMASVRLPSSLLLTATYGWVHATQRRVDLGGGLVTEPMSKTPPPNGTVRLSYEPRDGLFVEAALRWAMNQWRVSEADRHDVRICAEAPGCRGTPGFATLHLRGGYRLNDHLAATVVVQNLTDETYRYHASGIDEPGRSVVVSLEGAL